MNNPHLFAQIVRQFLPEIRQQTTLSPQPTAGIRLPEHIKLPNS